MEKHLGIIKTLNVLVLDVNICGRSYTYFKELGKNYDKLVTRSAMKNVVEMSETYLFSCIRGSEKCIQLKFYQPKNVYFFCFVV